MAALAMAAVIFGLARIAIVNSERRDAEKKRGDLLQNSVNALRDRSDEEQTLLELFRKFIVAQNAEDRKALLDQLRDFQFATSTTTTTTVRPRGTTTTTTTPKSSPTTAPRPPPSTTTTTVPPSPPPSQPCVTTPVINVCPQTAKTSERNHP